MEGTLNKPESESITEDNNNKSASVNGNQNKPEVNDSKSGMLPSDDRIPNTPGNEIKINKYLIIAVVVIIILLVIAYFLYHYNILGVRILVRHTLGLSTPGSA
ncbi:MAG: hypothetical protein M1580_00390 [Candidatus Parvarchaeota archaeon]|nr:hypothetical protein [Candidatus Parvarchaeota archaeon]